MKEEANKKPLKDLVYGASVAGVQVGDLVHGFTVSWVGQVSIEPPLLALAVAKTNKAHEYVRQTGSYSVSLLAADQERTARRFAGMEGEDEGLADLFRTKSCGPPVLQDCRAWLEVTLTEVLATGGDHDLFVGQVTGGGEGKRHGDPPLVLNQSDLPFYGA